MEFESFKDLSSFVYEENDKLTESFGLLITPKKTVKFMEKSLKKYTKLYDKPLFKKAKRELYLREVLDTLKYESLFWRFFHPKQWKIIQKMLSEVETSYEEKEEQTPETPIIQVPAVIIEKEKEITEEERKQVFLTDFEE